MIHMTYMTRIFLKVFWTRRTNTVNVRGKNSIILYSMTELNNVQRMSVTSLVYQEYPVRKTLVRSEIHASETIFDHLLNSYLWMPTKEKFYKYVRNTTRGKKCYVNQGSRKMFLTVPARFFTLLIVSKFVERAICWSLGDFSSMVSKRFT